MQFEMAVLLILMVVLIIVAAIAYVSLSGEFSNIFSPIKTVADPEEIKNRISAMPLINTAPHSFAEHF